MPNPKGAADSSGTPPSNNLWVANLTTDTSEADLNDLFRRYGPVDSITNYASRNFAFVHYKRVDDARKAKDSLQNALLRGNNIKIEFARPAKPCKNLWVGSISMSVTKDQLEKEFSKCGRIEDFKFLRDRNSALVEYYRLEDAVAAVKSMNGRRLGGEQIRVDFVRSHPSRRENLSDFHDSRDGNYNNRNRGPPEPYWEAADAIRRFPESSQFGNKMHAPLQYSSGWREGPPSKVLWVGYPPSVLIDEQMLHNAMILFGEIERIASFPSRHFSFVEFRSVDEARRAKEGLQGRLFNDPRIRIMFFNSEFALSNDIPGGFAGIGGPRPDMYFNEPNFGPGPLEFLGHNRSMPLNDFAGPYNSGVRPNMLTRPFGPQAGLDQLFSRPEVLNELAGLMNNFQDGNPNGHAVHSWRKSSPAPGLIPPSPQGMRSLPPIRPTSSMWEDSDPYVLERESKRLRMNGSPFNGTSFPARLMDDNGIRGGQTFGLDPQFDRGISSPVAQGQSRRSPLGPSPLDGENTDSDFIWRGVIAKGGTPVCHARCVPIGKGLTTQLPGIVNCSARTGLDMLAKHCGEASGFDIVFFLPDSEDDFASYTEFLRYLGAKNRAGVAKFEDGTTLFLVPPSDFLTKILNISGPERLYGVFLRLPQQKPSVSLHQQQSNSQSLVSDRHHQPALQTDQTSLPPKNDQVLQTDYSRVSHEGTMPHFPKSPLPPTDESPSMQSLPRDYARNSASIPQSGLSLTPELIATLTSLLPGGMQSSSTSAQIPSGSVSWEPTSLPASVASEQPTSSQGWTQSHQFNLPSTPNHSRDEQTINSQQFGYQFNSQAPYMSHIPAHLNIAQSLENSPPATFGNSEGQDPSQNVAEQSVPSSRSANNTVAPPGGQFTVPQRGNQQLQFDASINPQMGYGSGNAADASGVFPPSVYQQPKPSGTLSTQEQGINISVPVSGMSSETDNVNAFLPDRVQQLQSALSGVGQGTADGEAEKNQRYQSTLQFAANLLLQIQQQQQQKQGNTQAGNHQQ